MAKIKRTYSFEPVNDTGKYPITGCNAFTIYNAGNTVMTVNKTVPIEPLGSFKGEEAHPDIEEDFDCYLEFNTAFDVTPADYTTPTPGTFGSHGSSVNPAGIKEARAIIIKTHLTVS